MVILVAFLAVIIACTGFLVVFQAVRMQDLRRQRELAQQQSLNLMRLWVKMSQRPSEVPVDKLLAAMGGAIKDVMSGQPMVVNENVEQKVEEEQPYYPDVEFDEWLGAEGIPPAAGWWSPSQSVEPHENSN